MANIERTFIPGDQTGFHASEVYEYIVPASGSIATAIDLGRPYAAVAITCNDASGIPSRTLQARVARWGNGGTLNPLWTLNGDVRWASGTLPTSGGFDFLITNAFYITKFQPEFNGSLTAASTLYISAYDPGID